MQYDTRSCVCVCLFLFAFSALLLIFLLLLLSTTFFRDSGVLSKRRIYRNSEYFERARL